MVNSRRRNDGGSCVSRICHTAPSVVFGTAGDDHTLVSDTSPWILSTFCEASKSPAQRPSWDLATDSQWDGSPPRLGSSQEEEVGLRSEISLRTRQHPPFTVLFTPLQGSSTLLQVRSRLNILPRVSGCCQHYCLFLPPIRFPSLYWSQIFQFASVLFLRLFMRH